MKFHQNEAKSAVQMVTPPPQGAGEGENVEDTPELLLKMLVDAVWKLWIQLQIAASFVMVDLGGYQLLDMMVQWCVRNPHKAICIAAALLVFLLPFLIMLGIGLSTLLMTLTGFLVLEGILLSIVAVLLMGCVGFLVLAVLFVKQLNRTA